MTSLTEIFNGLDAEGVLVDLIGARNINDTGDELIHSCQLNFGLHKNGDSNPSASLNKNTLLFNCFTCGGGSIIWLVENVLGITKEQAVIELRNYISGVKVIPLENFIEKLNKTFSKAEYYSLYIPVYNDKILDLWTKETEYLTNRGVDPVIQKQMRTGINSKLEKTYDGKVVEVERVVIPHFINRKLVGWVTRKTDNSIDVAKYKNSKEFPRKESLYNIDWAQGASGVYVVESPMSVLVLKSRGIHNVVATFGAKVTKPQLNMLREFSEVIIFMDGDAPGRKAQHNLIDGLKDYTRLRIIDTPDGEDPASLNQLPMSVSAFEYMIGR